MLYHTFLLPSSWHFTTPIISMPEIAHFGMPDETYTTSATPFVSYFFSDLKDVSETSIYSIGSHAEHLGARTNGRFHSLRMSSWHSRRYSPVNHRLGPFHFSRETAALAQRTRRIRKEHTLYHDRPCPVRAGSSWCFRVLQQRRRGEKSVS